MSQDQVPPDFYLATLSLILEVVATVIRSKKHKLQKNFNTVICRWCAIPGGTEGANQNFSINYEGGP